MSKNNNFKFIGKGASEKNRTLDMLNELADNCGLKFGYTEDGFGNKLNALVLKKAKPNRKGFYEHKDIIGNWIDANSCVIFLFGYAASSNKKR